MAHTPIIFGPGFMCDAALFAAQVEGFSRDREVMLADFSSQTTIAEMASSLLSLAPPQFCFVGLSMGGIVGFELARQAPERLASLILLNTTAHPDTPAKRSNRIRQIERVQAGLLEQTVLEELKPNYLAEKSRKDKDLLSEIVSMTRRLGEGVFERQSCALMDRPDSRPPLGKIACPVILVAGAQDELCPPELHQAMQRDIPDATLHILSDCGHLSTMEQPDKANAIITQALLSVDDRMEKI